MKRKNLKEKSWYPMTIAACIAVLLYVFLIRFDDVRGAVHHFFGFFTPVIQAIIIAYLVSPLARLYRNTFFKRVKKEKIQNILSVLLAFLSVLFLLTFLLATLIPQLFESIMTFAGNLDGYMDTLNEMLHNLKINTENLHIDEFISSSEALLTTLTKLISDNIEKIIAASANTGRQVIEWGISFLLSIYLLAAKDKLTGGLSRLMQAIFGKDRSERTKVFLSRCNAILNRYIVYNLLDSLIVGVANAIFMAIVGLPYLGLVSFVVAIFNLIPTFGPIIGAVIGGFILLMVKPWYALAFLIFTVILQTIDGYYIKPKMFGDTLGISGLWILIGVIVGGRMFGMIGILLAIPAVAIFDFIYQENLLPWLERRQQKKEAVRAAVKMEEAGPATEVASALEADPQPENRPEDPEEKA